MSTPFQMAATRYASGAASATHLATELVAMMSADEKLESLDGDIDFWPGLAEMIGGGYGDHPWPGAACERLGIPGIDFSDGPRGCATGDATCFPVSMARGAAWDVELERAIGEAIGAEVRASGANFFGGVCINLLRHPAWGRAQETYGEDPLLVGSLGTALAQGAQQHVMACVKHFALNSMENSRFTVDVEVADDVLHEVYLPHFRMVVKAGVASVMSAYNSVNGEWCGQNRHLLTDVLRDLWQFDGFVVSDFISGVRDAARSVQAGLDIEMPFLMVRSQYLRAALESGDISVADIDASITRTVATQIRFAAVVDAPPDPTRVLSPAHRDLARRAATQSIVLLTNRDVLPLAPAVRSIAVIGRLAAMPNLGDRGSSRVRCSEVVTPLDGIRAGFEGADVSYDDGSDPARAAALAATADVAVVVVGYTHLDEGEYIGGSVMAELAALYPPRAPGDDEALAAAFQRAAADGGERAMGTGGDRTSLRLHAADEALIEAVGAANSRTVVCVMAGSSVIMPWADRVGAVLMLWYPGMEGGHALADVLSGRVCPSGRLPFTVPHAEEHLPFFERETSSITYDRWHGYTKLQRDGVAPHFPFGFGLGYTSLDIGEPRRTDGGVSVQVTNTGNVRGAQVVQVYGGVDHPDWADRPLWRLVGFARTADIEPGAAMTVDIDVHLHVLARWITGEQRWQAAPPHSVRLAVGASSADLSRAV
jgi:beta-glucosidase